MGKDKDREDGEVRGLADLETPGEMEAYAAGKIGNREMMYGPRRQAGFRVREKILRLLRLYCTMNDVELGDTVDTALWHFLQGRLQTTDKEFQATFWRAAKLTTVAPDAAKGEE